MQEERLKTKAEKKLGELKSEREPKEAIERIFAAMERFQASEIQEAEEEDVTTNA